MRAAGPMSEPRHQSERKQKAEPKGQAERKQKSEPKGQAEPKHEAEPEWLIEACERRASDVGA